MCLAIGVPGRFFRPLILHLPFSVASLQLDFLKSYTRTVELLGSSLDRWDYRLHSKILFHGFKMLGFAGAFFHRAFQIKGILVHAFRRIVSVLPNFVPIPVWFRYLISYGEFGNVTTWSLGILLALLYLILKLLDFFGHLRTFRQVLRIFFTRPSYGVPASKRQCSDMDGICPICQAEFQKPVLLFCQHIFCEECITLWFNREKTCPLCRTVISERINKWKDGATSSHLQMY